MGQLWVLWGSYGVLWGAIGRSIPLLPAFLAFTLSCAGPFPEVKRPPLNVAIVLRGSPIPSDLLNPPFPPGVTPVPLRMDEGDPRSLLVRLCDLLSSLKLHGVVFDDKAGAEAVAHILDFVSAQAAVPIVGVSGGAATVMAPKVRGGYGGLWVSMGLYGVRGGYGDLWVSMGPYGSLWS
uniref:Receptor ligand binding region domain-containing protein n=1 Tax=Coturnix japonica TaxID=93934 RepID=A0A8C2SNW2_COTJA